MKPFIVNTIILILGCWLSSALAEGTAPTMPSSTSSTSTNVQTAENIAPLLTALTKAKLSKSAKILVQLEQTGGTAMLPLFEQMLNGKLYYQRADAQIIYQVKDSNDTKQYFDIFSKAPLGALDSSLVKKIRVNSKLRTHLKNTIARIQLNHGNDEERLHAVIKLTEKLTQASIDELSAALKTEVNGKVREAIEKAIALYQLQTSEDTPSKLIAIAALSGSLDSKVRNALLKLVEKNSEGKYIEKDRKVRVAVQAELKRIDGRIKIFGFIEKMFFGLSAGSVLLLAAIGLAITFGVMGVFNMAHGEMIMIGAYTTYGVQLLMPNFMEYSLFVAIPAAFLVAGIVGMIIEATVIRHLHGRPLETLLATFGISLILQQAVRSFISATNRPVVTPEWMSGSLEINPIFSLTYNRIYILIFSLIVFFLLLTILKKTALGLHVRAVSQNRAMAKSLGIRTAWVDSMTFALGSGIAGVAGVALSQITNVGPNMGQDYIIGSFMVVVFGGVGNLFGTLVGAFSLGIANKFLEPATGAVLANILVLVFIILFIQRRPKGLFPQKGRAAD